MEEIILRHKDGSVFRGDPTECARVLMSSGLALECTTGVPYGRWEAEEFCKRFQLNPMTIRRDVGDRRIFT